MDSQPRRLCAQYHVTSCVETVCRVTALGAERDLTRQPVQGAGGAHAGFVEARHGGGGGQVADGRLNRLQPLGTVGFEVGERALAEGLAGEEVAHDLGEPVEGQELVLAQIDAHALWESLATCSLSDLTSSRRPWHSARRAAFSVLSAATSVFSKSSSRDNSQSIRAAVSGSVRQTVKACS